MTMTSSSSAKLNVTQLARVLGVPRSMVLMMRACGLPMMCGKTTQQDARAWIASNPDFLVKRPPMLNIGELAMVMGVPYHYVRGMRLWGFAMPGGRATEDDARAWLKGNPGFRPCVPPPVKEEELVAQ